MIRAEVFFLALLLSFSGCGEPDAQPRFTPAKGTEPSSTSGEHRADDKASRQITIPKNIESH